MHALFISLGKKPFISFYLEENFYLLRTTFLSVCSHRQNGVHS